MNNRERVMAALHGQPVDRVPISFWLHNFAAENSATGLAEETLRLAGEFGWDFLKPQSRAQGFAEMWGLTYRPSDQQAVPYTVTHTPLTGADDLRRLRPVDPLGGALGEQLEALRLIRAGVGPDTPIIWTVFAPLMVAPYLLRGGRAQLLELLRSEPAAVESALAAMTETLAGYARACLAAGADGLFYATNVATRDLLTPEECRRFQRPYDLPILAAVDAAPFNLLHVCGSGILFDEFADYPVTAFSWATVPENPTLSEVHRRTGRAVVGGLPAKPTIVSVSAEELIARAGGAIDDMQGRWLLLGPDCSINPETSEALLASVTEGARQATLP